MTTAPLEEKVLASIVSRDDFHATFALFLEAERAFRGSRRARVARGARSSGLRRARSGA
jgi:hypothetical protein